MAGDQQLHQLSIEQFVSAQDAQTEAKNGANAKFQEQMHSGLEALRNGQPIDASRSSHRADSPQQQVLDFGVEKKGSAGESGAEVHKNRDKHITLENDRAGNFFEQAMKEPSDSIIERIRGFRKEVTPEDRKEAKDKLGKDISPLITEADAKTLKSMQEAIVDGNVGKLAETLKNMPPERAKAFIKELNKELKSHNANVELSATSDGRVFVYETSGQTAIQINRDGTTTVKPIKHNYDGSSVVEPGEIINKDADEVMKGISDTAVRGMTGGNRIIWEEGPPPYFPKKPDYPRWPTEPEFPRWPKEDPIWKDPPVWKPLLEKRPDWLEELLKRPYLNQRDNDILQF